MTTTRLIERWLPIAEIGIESVRERTPMTPFPAPNRLHVWWARRPLVASRAAVLASILPEDADRQAFKHALGIHGDPVRGVALIDKAKRTGERVDNPYGYERAFKFTPTPQQLDDLVGRDRSNTVVLDVTAGGGAIPFEALRLGFSVIANDINPVAALILKATVEYPKEFGQDLIPEFKALSSDLKTLIAQQLEPCVSNHRGQQVDTTYLWARTTQCPYCAGKIPLSPNWKLAPDGRGVRLVPQLQSGPGDESRRCNFEIVEDLTDHAPATVANRDALCPFPDCGRTISGDEIKRQAVACQNDDQLFAIVIKRQIQVPTKSGGSRTKWVRDFRAPDVTDEVFTSSRNLLAEKLVEWSALDLIPSEEIWSNGKGSRVNDPGLYGTNRWVDFFSDRQLLAHGLGVEVYRSMLQRDQSDGLMTPVRTAAYVYLALALSKLVDWNSKQCTWEISKQAMAHTFAMHGYPVRWSYAEMSLLVDGMGYDWVLDATAKALKELIGMVGKGGSADLFATDAAQPTVRVSNGSGAQLVMIEDDTVDAVVVDPPYGANVMYSELADFFYVWLKRTAGVVVPELFTRTLTDKEDEAVANKALFHGQTGADALATENYLEKMAGIFRECRRVLKADGLMTVMFTHKDTGAWDALAMSLMDAGFVITASWPVNTEASGSLHIKDKAAANSTIFLVCRPRDRMQDEAVYWEDVEPEVARAVRVRVGEYQKAGISGVDLYLASFGPALEAFSRHWPLTRGMPAPEPKKKRRAQGDMFEEFDPYAVRPEDALNAARREVKAWRLSQLASAKAQADMDGPTAFYVLAWDAFKAVSFPYDEALRLARAVGVDLDTQVIGRLGEKKTAEIKLWDSATRVAKGAIGPADGTRGMIDALHHAANTVRARGVEAAVEQLEAVGIAHDDEFKVALEAVLEVLPPSKTFSGIDADKAVKPAADDFDALETLRRIAYANEIGEPQQLELYREMLAAG